MLKGLKRLVERLLERRAAKLLALAGIQINGPNPWDIQVHDPKVYELAFSEGTLGIGKAYMKGLWDVEDLLEFFFRVSSSPLRDELKRVGTLWYVLQARLMNMQSKRRARRVIEEHYQIDEDDALYPPMLGPSMAYTCGYWKSAKTLDEAQYAKYDLICRKLGLKSGQVVLDIGGGWGGFAKYAAERYGVRVVVVTLSTNQAEFGKKECQGLSVEFRVQDYRDITGVYDHVVCIGMFEHVGAKNYRTFMRKVWSLLADEGLFLLHCIGSRRTTLHADRWIHKYIFPNGMLPSVGQIGAAIDRLFIMEDWHNFGYDYYPTLMAWAENFKEAWPALHASNPEKYSERFYRMWLYYLYSMVGSFKARRTHLWQVVLSKRGVLGGYESIR